jgi:hypothetical protein
MAGTAATINIASSAPNNINFFIFPLCSVFVY